MRTEKTRITVVIATNAENRKKDHFREAPGIAAAFKAYTKPKSVRCSTVPQPLFLEILIRQWSEGVGVYVAFNQTIRLTLIGLCKTGMRERSG